MTNQQYKYSDWESFDPIEYVQRNYGSMLPEDKAIILALKNDLETLGIGKNSLKVVADVGTGPNLYPALLMSEYAQHIDLIEYSQANLDYLRGVINDDPSKLNKKQIKLWEQYALMLESLLDLSSGQLFRNMLGKVSVRSGNIFELPKSEYELVSSFFVTESITNDISIFRKTLASLLSSLMNGGIFVVAHMLGSKGYYAGIGTNFPSTYLTMSSLHKIYSSFPTISSFKAHEIIVDDDVPRARDGYHGMALVVGEVK